ncbi:MAG: proline--tRNA ligase [Elusimicrobia bacterium HGW-Elusimicrobia-1]|jgi:prolyl-tRNA synthetase|nr:MAG: proline--tRNA ligase [Elusimicrobia bacterium HGW-Elusimicrobia-1]
MRYSQIFVPTLKNPPSDADNVSIKLMSRAGMLRKLSSGLYEWLPVGLRVLKKVENIIREEMNRAGGQEVSLPILQPRELWEETGRWGVYGKELFRLKDRKNSDFCLGPTHEEVITDIVRRDVRSYKELPLMLYQFGTKFRDEIRPRFGVMRAREFLMKDAYSFHASEEDAEKYYEKVFDAYKRICDRCGFDYRAVEAATGAIGGRHSHEFMVLASTGEELIAHCSCGYGANVEKAECLPADAPAASDESLESLKEVHTPGKRSVGQVGEFLKLPPEKFIKTLIYRAQDKVVMVLIRGDRGINEAKLAERLGAAEVELAAPEAVAEITGAAAGFAGPVPKNQKINLLLADNSVRSIVNGVSGANKTDYHVTGINIGRDFAPDGILDLALVAEGDVCPRCRREKLSFSRGIEVGHTFKLGKKYSEALNAVFLDAEGKQVHFIMGCYGIGVSRMVAAAIEQSNDADGIIWPVPIAPYQAVVVPVDTGDEKIMAVAEAIYDKLIAADVEAVLDDRAERPGVKFKDADLIGFPVRVTVGKKLAEGLVELRLRKEKTSVDVTVAEAAETAIKAIGIK